jgi:DNA-binding GntR family transcriptional regulator
MMGKMSTKTAKLVSSLAGRIKEKILASEFPPGYRLRQEKLAEIFDVSRTPVREALRELEALGIVEQHPKQGAIVRSPSARDIREAFAVRAELEGLAIQLAIEWITDKQLEDAQSAQSDYAREIAAYIATKRETSTKARVNKQMGWVTANDRFHKIILDACQNRRLMQTVTDLNQSIIRNVMWLTYGIDGRQMKENIAQHDALLDAVHRRDPAEARRVMVHHIGRAGEIFARWLEQHHSR